MSVSPEILFHRSICRRHPRGLADLDDPEAAVRWNLTPGDLSALALVRDAVNAALSHAKTDVLHHPCGILYFSYIDAEVASAEAFDSHNYSFIGMSIPMAKDVLRVALRLRASIDVWNGVGLQPLETDPNSFQFLVMFLAMLFIAAHEYCHHVLGHQASTLSAADPRAASLRGNLQSQTRELGADGYAAMHLLQHVIAGDFRSEAVKLLGLEEYEESPCDRTLFLLVLIAVAATWYRRRPDVLDRENVYLFSHPPRAVRLSVYMEHTGVWARGSRPSLDRPIGGQDFANLVYVVGLAVCDHPEDADSRQQNEFMRSPDGQEYARELLSNLELHKSLMGS